jgi:hypothetical protein
LEEDGPYQKGDYQRGDQDNEKPRESKLGNKGAIAEGPCLKSDE